MLYTETLIEKVRSGVLSPEEAMESFDCPAVFLKDIELQPQVDVVPSGFPTLDDYSLLKRGRSELIILGARPSHGKSALAFQIAANVAAKEGSTLIFSLEMDKEAILKRLVAGQTGKGLKNLEHASKAILEKARQYFASLPLAIDERSGLDINSIRSSARAFNKKHPLKLVVVDYIQIVRSRELGNRNNEIGEITGGLKAMAKEFKCPVIALSQLNRECERRGKDPRGGSFGDYRPMLADLRDSGSIEADADVVMFLSRQEVYDGTRPGIADIRIAKNRNGEIGDFTLKFSGTQTKFYDPKEDI